MKLTGRQRKTLRGLAHALAPVVQVGRAGVTSEVASQLDAVLGAHELVKVRFLDGEQKAARSAALARATGAAHVGSIGHVAIFYRRHPEPEKRRVRLPGAGEPD
jgi:RNA-binding protein